MASFDLLESLVSPTGEILATEVGALLFVVAGFGFMFGWRRFAKRLMVLAVIIIAIPAVVAANFTDIKSILYNTPRWVLFPMLAIGAAIIACWILWGVTTLFFGPAIANSVTADILSWLIKGCVLAALAPYRGLSGLLRRFAPRDTID